MPSSLESCEGADVQLIDDGVLVPEGVGGAAGFLHACCVSEVSWMRFFAVRLTVAGILSCEFPYGIGRIRDIQILVCKDSG